MHWRDILRMRANPATPLTHRTAAAPNHSTPPGPRARFGYAGQVGRRELRPPAAPYSTDDQGEAR